MNVSEGLSLIRGILVPPLRDRVRVENALLACPRRWILLLGGLLNAGLVRGDWRRALVRKRIRVLTELLC
jgi:hypothetical protein